MKSTDLRIGNYIAFNEDDSISKVIGIHTNPCGVDVQIGDEETYIELRQFSVIDLNEEILLKCGFFYDIDSETFKIHNSTLQIDIYNLEIPEAIVFGEFLRHVKHLHTLQNLFYSLTGQELNVKL